MQFESLQRLAALSAARGIHQAVISPGSRSALIAVAFSRHPDIHVEVVNDERSAAYIAIGMAQTLGQPVVLICTSGTAALNYGPAVAEARFQQIPLLILTADRPPQFLGRDDGQMIYQDDLYGRHVKYFTSLPVYMARDKIQTIQDKFTTAVNHVFNRPAGPVHCNIPIAEPFYPEIDALQKDQPKFEAIQNVIPDQPADDTWTGRLQHYRKILILIARQEPNRQLQNALTGIKNIPMIVECTSNIFGHPSSVPFPDIFFRNYKSHDYQDYRPDLLITVGSQIISRPLKTVIRSWSDFDHWHIQPAGDPADVFFSDPELIAAEPEVFFSILAENLPPVDKVYFQRWQKEAVMIHDRLDNQWQTDTAWNEYMVTRQLVVHLLDETVLHLGNSMPVRWANLCAIPPGIAVYSNRGTSGIDGVLSTAVGQALADNRQHVVLIGDISFFYDRNALWLKSIPENLRIIVLNNGGGGIFSLIDGPSRLPELQELFVTYQTASVRSLADEYGIPYRCVTRRSDCKAAMAWITEARKECRILEAKVAVRENQRIYQNLMEMD